MKFLAQAICCPKRFSYKPIPKTDVSKTRTNHSSTFRDLTQCSAHVFAEKFILLNSRLNELSVESKNMQIRFRTGKLWLSEVDGAES